MLVPVRAQKFFAQASFEEVGGEHHIPDIFWRKQLLRLGLCKIVIHITNIIYDFLNFRRKNLNGDAYAHRTHWHWNYWWRCR